MRSASRELVLDGLPRTVEPRPFDMLVYLIEHRQRVVTKAELLNQLWPHEFVSGGVIARAVMKARQAIGDDGKEPALIKTVHGVGYRFIGQLLPHEAAPAARAAAAPGFLSVALLPFENRTGHADLDWIELGLLSMVAKALDGDPRLRLPSIPSLLTALGSLTPQASLDDRVSVVQRLLGVHHVVQVTITRDADQYVLDYRIAPDARRARLLDDELTRLGQRLAGALEAALFATDAAALPAAYESADPLANQALARALQAAAEQKWRIAANLFKVVLDIEPNNMQVRLEYLRALVPLGDEGSHAIGLQLLARARATADTRLEIATRQALAAAFIKRNMHEPATSHLNEALRLAQGLGLFVEQAAALRQLAVISMAHQDFAAAGRSLGQVERLLDPVGDPLERLAYLINAAVVARRLGDPAGAVRLGRQAVMLNREHRRSIALASALLNLVHACVDVGLMQEAVVHGEEALATATAARNSLRTVLASESLSWLYRELRAPKRSARVVAQVLVPDGASPVLHGEVLRARAHHAACEGDHERAAAYMREAIETYQAVLAGPPEDAAMPLMVGAYLHDAMPSLVASLVRCGRLDDAAAACTEAQGLPGFSADARLQAGVGHCRALIAHARGEHAEARRRLAEVADTAPPGLWLAFARLDGAWLAIEAGDIAAAQQLVRDLGPWLQQHPVGLVVDARLQFATGQYAAAHAAQAAYANSIESALPACHAELGRIYDQATRQPPASPPVLLATPWLPTSI